MSKIRHRIDIVQGEGGGGCFAAGTLISTPNGSINIEDISVGDEVYGFDDSGEVSVNKVTKVFVHENNDIYSFKFWGGELLLNAIHWILNGRNTFFQAKHFDTDECVVDESGEFRPFKSLEFLKAGTVYNFWVENDHTYIANGVRVHNGGGGGGKGTAQARTPVEDPEGIVYGTSDEDRYVSQAKIQIMDMVCEGEVEGLVRGAREYIGTKGNIGYDRSRFIPYRSQIGQMEGITAEIEQKCTYGVKAMEKRENTISVQTRVNSQYLFNFKSHEGPEPGKDHIGLKLWVSSGPHNPTFPKVTATLGRSSIPPNAAGWSYEADAISDPNGGDDFISGNWKAYETWQAGKNHPGGASAKSYDFAGSLPKIHSDVSVQIDEVKGKWSGDIGGSAVSWIPYVAGSHYSQRLVRIAQQPTAGNEYETIVEIDTEHLDSEIDVPGGIVDGVVMGPASGRRANPAWWAIAFTLYGTSQKPICKALTDPPVEALDEVIVTDGFEYLRSIYWNGTPILDSTGLINFQQVSLNYTEGAPNGIRTDEADSLIKGTSKVRIAGEKLKGPTQELDEHDNLTGNVINDLDDFATVYRVSNKNCNAVTINVRIGSLSVLLKEDKEIAGQPASQAAVGSIDLGFAQENEYNNAGMFMFGWAGRNAPIQMSTEAESTTMGSGDPREGGAGDLLRTSVIYIIQWKPFFNTPGEYREWPSLFRSTKKYGLGPNSEVTSEEESGQIEETLWGKISYGYNKSTRINFSRHAELVNRNDFLGWEIRIVRTTPESISPSTQNTTYVDSLIEHYDIELSYPNCAAVTSTFDAEFFSEPPGRSFDMEMLKVKVPSNYNPILRTYGQNRGGCDEEVFHQSTYIKYSPGLGDPQDGLPKGEPGDNWESALTAETASTGPFGKGSQVVVPTSTPDANVNDEGVQVQLNTSGVYEPSIGGGLPSISGGDAFVNGTEEYWDGTFKSDLNGTIIKQYTNNPAWCFYDLMTNQRYGLGKHIDSNLVDKWSIFEIAKYCDELVDDGKGGIEPRFTSNLLIGSREEAFKVLNDLSSVFRGMMYYHGGMIQAIQDAPKMPVYQFTNANVLNGEFSYQSTSRKVRRNVAVIRYNDPEDEYKPAVEYVENLPDIKKFGIRELEITAFGCTSQGQARRLGNWALLSESLETESVGFSAGLEGAYLRPGDVIQVHDYDRKGDAHGGRVQKFETIGLTGAKVTLDREITGLSGVNDTYKFSMLTPSHYLDPSLMDEGEMNSADTSEVRNNLIQSVYFTAAQTRPISGETTIRFDYSSLNRSGLNGRVGVAYPPLQILAHQLIGPDAFGDDLTAEQIETSHIDADRTVTSTGKWPITGFNNFSHNLTGDIQFVWTMEKSGVPTIEDKAYDLFKVISIEEKEINNYSIKAIEHQTGKFLLAESGISFDRTTYAQTPADPEHLFLKTAGPPGAEEPWEGPLNSIHYNIIGDKTDSATVGYQVYVVAQPVSFTTAQVDGAGRPHSTYLAARVDNIDPQGYYIPSDKFGLQTFWFRAFSINAANDLSKNYVESSISMEVPKGIGNVIISSLSLLNPLNARLEEEDKSMGPGTDFKYNTDIPGNRPGVNLSQMTFATGQSLLPSPKFGWQVGYVGLKPGSRASTNFKYRLTVREPNQLSTSDGTIQNPIPSKNIFYEITGLSSTDAQTAFIYHTSLNQDQAAQISVPYDANGDALAPWSSAASPGDGNPALLPTGPYRDYDVVVEAHDDDGFSSATLDTLNYFGVGHLIRSFDGSRKDVEYSNGAGYDIMYVSNPRPGSIDLEKDIRNVALAIPAKDIQFTFSDNVLPIDTAGVVAWFSTEPFSETDILSHKQFPDGSRMRYNANKDGFLVGYGHTTQTPVGEVNGVMVVGIETETLYNAYDGTASRDTTTDKAGLRGPIFRSIFSFESTSTIGPKTARFNIDPLIQTNPSFKSIYMMIAVYDSFDKSIMSNFLETNGGASDINIISSQNLMSLGPIISKVGDQRDALAIPDIAGQANKLVAYISVEAINKVEKTEQPSGSKKKGDVRNVRWTHMGFLTYSVRRVLGDPVPEGSTSSVVVVDPKSIFNRNRRGPVMVIPETYEHTAIFNPEKAGFKSGDEYMLRVSSNVLTVSKYPDESKKATEPDGYNVSKLVWTSEAAGHPDLDRAMVLDVYRI